MSIAGLILGIINIAIVAAILVLLGLLVVWLAGALQWPIPWNVQRIYLLIVLLVCLYMFAALLLGMPTWRIIGPSVPIT